MGMDHKTVAGGARPSGGGARILQFKRGLSARRRPVPPIVHPLRRYDEEEDRLRMRENLAAAGIILVLIVSGFWLIDHLRTSARIAACLEAGHHDCVPLD